jgi:hypothetical protein
VDERQPRGGEYGWWCSQRGGGHARHSRLHGSRELLRLRLQLRLHRRRGRGRREGGGLHLSLKLVHRRRIDATTTHGGSVPHSRVYILGKGCSLGRRVAGQAQREAATAQAITHCHTHTHSLSLSGVQRTRCVYTRWLLPLFCGLCVVNPVECPPTYPSGEKAHQVRSLSKLREKRAKLREKTRFQEGPKTTGIKRTRVWESTGWLGWLSDSVSIVAR